MSTRYNVLITQIKNQLTVYSVYFRIQCDNKKLGNLRSAFEGCSNKIKMTSFVCIQSKGEHICGDLKSIGLNAVNISWDGMVTQPKNIAKLLMSLDTLLRNSNTIGSSSFVCSEQDANKSNCNSTFTSFVFD